MTQLRWLNLITLILALFVIALGAYTRLKDAGLGCPDWPGCYGKLTVPSLQEDILLANEQYPLRPVEAAKAWPEMIHRYMAGTLGLCILMLAFLNFKYKTPERTLTTGLLLLVVGQALLGMWTVTLKLFPTVVMAHLLGGFATFTLLCLLYIKQTPSFHQAQANLIVADTQYRSLYNLSLIALTVLILQISLGGWTAANYAATICTSLPICQGNWAEHLNFSSAFKLWGHGAIDYEFARHLAPDAKITIHVSHRFGAVITTLLILACIIKLFAIQHKITTYSALLLCSLLLVQVTLGVSNILFQLPLAIAVAHNLVAALLLAMLACIHFWAYTRLPNNDSKNSDFKPANPV